MTLLQTPAATYRVDGMTCDHCRMAVMAEVTSVAGVAAVEVERLPDEHPRGGRAVAPAS